MALTEKKNILFCVFSLNLGGVETFIVRLKETCADLFNIKVLLMTDFVDAGLASRFGGGIYYLSDYTKFDFLSFNKGILRSALPLDIRKIVRDFCDIDVFHSTCSFSMSVLNKIRCSTGKGYLTAGVYHSKEYTWGRNSEFMRGDQIDLFNSLPKKNVFFMNECTVSEYVNKFGKDYFIILPIGVDVLKYSAVGPDYDSKLIVSVGRLINFKSYNWLMLGAIATLRSKGFNFKYDIYGDGPERSKLECKIKEFGLETDVRLMGSLDYSKMPDILGGAFLFVGSGTAMVEAAAAGVPSMIGIESSSEAVTYGLLTDTVGYSAHEAGLNYPLKKYEDVILNLNSMNYSQYQKISLNSRERARLFSIENMRAVFYEFVEGLVVVDVNQKNSARYFLGTYIWVLRCALGLAKDRETMYL